jgi:fatty acid desaturase
MPARWDLLFVALAGGHAAAVLAFPSAPLIAAGVWWNSNTIAHNFIHRRFFRSRSLNAIFSIGQSVLMGIPQTLWRDRHLAHHAGVEWRL